MYETLNVCRRKFNFKYTAWKAINVRPCNNFKRVCVSFLNYPQLIKKCTIFLLIYLNTSLFVCLLFKPSEYHVKWALIIENNLILRLNNKRFTSALFLRCEQTKLYMPDKYQYVLKGTAFQIIYVWKTHVELEILLCYFTIFNFWNKVKSLLLLF